MGARRNAYRLLLHKGLIRVETLVPENAEFQVISVANPYGCDEMDTLSVYRRPLPATNLRFLSALMWDGRESSIQSGTQPITYNTNPDDLRADLTHQAMDATLGHAQAPVAPTQEQLQAIVDFEMAMVTAQGLDFHAGPLDAHGATGGPVTLGRQTMPGFYIGINDPLGGNPRGVPFNPNVFKVFDAWMNGPQHPGEPANAQGVRASIARGQALFNSKPISISGVAGRNDALHLDSITGTCGTCHDAPNAGNHSIAVPLNIGIADPDSALDMSFLPVITLQNKVTQEIKELYSRAAGRARAGRAAAWRGGAGSLPGEIPSWARHVRAVEADRQGEGRELGARAVRRGAAGRRGGRRGGGLRYAVGELLSCSRCVGWSSLALVGLRCHPPARGAGRHAGPGAPRAQRLPARRASPCALRARRSAAGAGAGRAGWP